MIVRAFFAVSLICLTIVPAVAQESAPDAEGGRYSLQEVRAGILRLDRTSGEVSLCREREGSWTCELIADDRAALADEIDRLEVENAKLKTRVDALEARLAAVADLAEQPIEEPASQEKILEYKAGETEERVDDELDKALDATERAMRRFFGMVQEFKQDLETSQPQ